MAPPPDRHGSYGRRLLGGAGAALVVLVLGALLGPSPDQVDEWLARTGREGPLVLMDDIAVVPDDAPVSTSRQRSMSGATQGLRVATEEVEEATEEDALRPVTPTRGNPLARTEALDRPLPGQAVGPDPSDQVRMDRPGQTSPDFVLLEFVRPDYPGDAPPGARAREVTVHVAMYVDEAGRVQHAYIVNSDGGPSFDREVLAAVRQWEYKPVVLDGQPTGFWDQMKITFVIGRDRPGVRG